MDTRMHPRRILRACVATTAVGSLALFAGPAALAQEPEVSVEPDSGLSDGDTVTVTATGLDEIDGQQAGVIQCGNADSEGNPIPASAAEDRESFAANCFGASDLGTPQVVLVGVADGSLTADYPVVTSGIGENDATCIPNADAELPCQIVVADLNTQGETLTVTAPIDFGGAEGEAEAEGEGEADGEEETEELAETGVGILPIALGGAGFAGAGSLALVVTRLRRRKQ